MEVQLADLLGDRSDVYLVGAGGLRLTARLAGTMTFGERDGVRAFVQDGSGRSSF